ncbi:MAG: exo-beta-N-acetylmuramidase NamZ family protein [Catonella sp.]|uniref:exo-beta-N-acetylmuramidase NamZ family protein n=1 Tax=Catonella sp. TaxID=2382125 RepID=UPI003FA12708
MKVLNGIDHLEDAKSLLKGKSIGLITNSAGVNADLVHDTKIFQKLDFHIETLLAPEHGIWGNIPAGEIVNDGIDRITGLPVSSLYNDERKNLSKEVIGKLDIIVYDIQDVGSRFYTYISLLKNVMNDCKNTGLSLLILDRINPLGSQVEGNILKKDYFSYVGTAALPQRYGLTVGELSRLFDSEIGLKDKLHILKVLNWDRNKVIPETGLVFMPPSPNIPNFETALAYTGLCLLEGTSISEGRGTTLPFLQFGAPFIKADILAKELNRLKLPSVIFTPAFFTPTFSKYKGEICEGVKLHITDYYKYQPVETGFRILYTLKHLYEDDFKLLPREKNSKHSFFTLLTGTKLFTEENTDIEELIENFKRDSETFDNIRKQYLLYQEE